jgi:hypothetical protein
MRPWLVCLLLTAAPVVAQPAQIILLRHAEKPDDKSDVHLSSRGQERAQALVALLGRHSPYTSNAPVVALFATRITKNNRSLRTGETLAPLSRELDLPVQTWFESEDYARLARTVLKEPAYRDQTVIICWTHSEIARLAEALGVKPAPRPWKDKVFDRLWILTRTQAGTVMRQAPQRLLPGDSAH